MSAQPAAKYAADDWSPEATNARRLVLRDEAIEWITTVDDWIRVGDPAGVLEDLKRHLMKCHSWIYFDGQDLAAAEAEIARLREELLKIGRRAFWEAKEQRKLT